MTGIGDPATGDGARVYRGLSKADRQSERRERLLEVAFDALGRLGVEGVSMKLIAAQARVQDKHLREHFESVQDLYLAVYRQLATDIGRRMTMRFFEAEGPKDLNVGFRASLRELFVYLQEDPRRARILVVDAFTQGLQDPTNMTAYISRYSEILRYRLKQRFPTLEASFDPQVLLAGLVGQIMGVVMVWVSKGFDLSPERLLDHCMFGFSGMLVWLEAESQGATTAPPSPPSGE